MSFDESVKKMYSYEYKDRLVASDPNEGRSCDVEGVPSVRLPSFPYYQKETTMHDDDAAVLNVAFRTAMPTNPK